MEKLGEKILDTVTDAGKLVAEKWFGWWQKPLIDGFKEHVALNCIDESMCQTPEVAAWVVNLKEEWANSPSSPEDIANDLITAVAGKGALRLSSISARTP